MRNLVLTGALLVFAATAGSAQDCKVSVQNLSGSYTGECKGGKAEGKGKAVGIDTYDGEFKSGYPEGTGKYSWKEGSWFTGTWKKGLREGEGEMHYKTNEGKDSTVIGFWKKDIYQGRYEKPYKIISQSTKISALKVNRTAGSKNNEINITVTNTTGGMSVVTGNGTSSTDLPKLKLGDIDISKGNFTQRTNIDNSAKETRTTLKGVEYPFKATFRVEDHMFEIEFFEAGTYSVDVAILQ